MNDVMVNVGRDRRCGCIYMATIDDNRPDRREDIVTAVAEIIRDGDVVERMTLASYKAVGFGDCAVCQAAAQEPSEAVVRDWMKQESTL